MPKTTRLVIVLLALLVMCGCLGGDPQRVKELQTLISERLKPGDSSDKIEAFFTEQRLPFIYDRLGQCYDSVVPSSKRTNLIGVERDIGIRIYVDQRKAFQKAEVRNRYTYL